MRTDIIWAANSMDRLSENYAKGRVSIQDSILYLIIAFSILFVLLLSIVIINSKKKNRLWVARRMLRTKSYAFDQTFLSIYYYLKNLPLTRNYIERLSSRFRMSSPCDRKTIARKTVTTCLISWLFSLLAFVFIFVSNQRFITLIIVGFTIYIVNSEVVGRLAKIFEISTLHELQKLIANVEHYFYVEYRVDDAVYRSLDHLSPNMKVAADQIYQLLLSDEKEEALREYYENIPNKFLKAFVSQCVGAMERGEQIVDGSPLFIRNLENLHREIDIEIDKLQRLSMEFLGVILCVIAPIFFIDFVKQFAISLKENMDVFYYGKEGFLLDIGLLLVIGCIYTIMRKSAEYTPYYQANNRWLFILDRVPFIKRAMDNYCDNKATKLERLKRELRNSGHNMRARHFLLRSFLLSVCVGFIAIGVTLYLQEISRQQLLVVERTDVEVLTSAAKESQYETMGKIIEAYTLTYLSETQDWPVTKDVLIEKLKREGTIYNQIIQEVLADEIYRRVEKYKKEYFSFIDLVLCLVLGYLAYYIPKGMLVFNSTVSKEAMEDEVNQFNALICMLMHIESMTVKQILEELEAFAVVFKQSLRVCLNDYGSGDRIALKEMKDREPYEPFSRIIDNLIRCDAMPIYQAFHEINVERDGYMAKRKLANEKSIRKRVVRAYVLAAVPFILLFAYGLVPTLMTSMGELNAMIMELENSAW